MKHIIAYLCFFAFVFSGMFRVPDIVGTWKSESDIIEFKGSGKCIVNSEKSGYRSIGDGKLVLINSGGYKTYSYMMSFDKQSMYFCNKRYTRLNQSGLESSIMELLL